MSCFEDSVQEPLWALDFTDYDTAELNTLISLIDATQTWMAANGLSTSAEDVIGFRVGMPVSLPSDVLEITTLYTAKGDLDQLVKSVSLDALKLSKKTIVDGVTYSQPYTFKSAFQHDIFANYFVEGVENNSGLTYLDGQRMNLSKHAGIPIQYEGTVAKQLTPLDVPADVYGCVVYVIQNATLYTEFKETAVPKKGDVTYYSMTEFYGHLSTIRAEALDIATRVATPYQEDIHELMVYLGMDQAFRDIQFGGGFDDMRIAMRIPASRENQATLEGLLGHGDVFNDIFKIRTFTHTDIDVDGSEKKEHLQDPFSNDKLDYPELDDNVLGYGCHGTMYLSSATGIYYATAEECAAANEGIPLAFCTQSERYRYWYVSEDWLNSLTTEQLSIVFWMGLDIMTERGDPCPFDKILTIIIVVVMTFVSAGLGTTTSLTVMQGLTVLSGLISIASTLGLIDAKTANALGAILAIATLGASVATNTLTATSALSQAIQIASSVLATVQAFEIEEFAKEMEAKKDELEQMTEDAELWESNFRFTYGGSFEMGVRNGPESDPYKYLKDTYDQYSSYTTPGFQ